LIPYTPPNDSTFVCLFFFKVEFFGRVLVIHCLHFLTSYSVLNCSCQAFLLLQWILSPHLQPLSIFIHYLLPPFSVPGFSPPIHQLPVFPLLDLFILLPLNAYGLRSQALETLVY
jgi:hypothetical protein